MGKIKLDKQEIRKNESLGTSQIAIITDTVLVRIGHGHLKQCALVIGRNGIGYKMMLNSSTSICALKFIDFHMRPPKASQLVHKLFGSVAQKSTQGVKLPP